MDASRLVFISVKDAKPKRKIALPVPDDATWDQFVQQVQSKLKLSSIDSIYLASSGEKITKLEDLQDIDELHVVEGSQPSVALENGSATVSQPGYKVLAQEAGSNHRSAAADEQHRSSAPSHASSYHRVAVADASSRQQQQGDAEGDMGRKYAKRSSGLRRTLQRFMPALFQPSLPVTTKDVKEETRGLAAEGRQASASRTRRRRGKTFTLRNAVTLLVLLGFLAMLSIMYSRLWPRLPA
ncbi:g1056 [Coccomyxa viridis]|uniref:G1056 protein n=1 Tax=Coccomyxa viridis TaxID=1274662 RepID=A0ABP1FH53_9CHLO